MYMPFDLIELCYLYFNETIDWNLSGNKLSQFVNAAHDEIRIGPQFTLFDIRFQLTAYPQGMRTTRNPGYTNIFIQLLTKNGQFPTDVQNFTVYAHLYCSQSQISWKKLMTLSALKRTSKKMRFGWFRYMLPLAHYDHMKSITFCCSTELIHIQRKIDCKIPRAIPNVKMNRKCEYQWDIDRATLNAFKSAVRGQCFYSVAEFNGGCFGLVVIPKGRVTDDDKVPSFRTFVKLLRIPRNVGAVKCECTLQLMTAAETDLNVQYSFCETLGILRRQKAASTTLHWPFGDEIFDQSLAIKVTMQINAVYDRENIVIDEDIWQTYDVH